MSFKIVADESYGGLMIYTEMNYKIKETEK